jgi:hypothetical protein
MRSVNLKLVDERTGRLVSFAEARRSAPWLSDPTGAV